MIDNDAEVAAALAAAVEVRLCTNCARTRGAKAPNAVLLVTCKFRFPALRHATARCRKRPVGNFDGILQEWNSRTCILSPSDFPDLDQPGAAGRRLHGLQSQQQQQRQRRRQQQQQPRRRRWGLQQQRQKRGHWRWPQQRHQQQQRQQQPQQHTLQRPRWQRRRLAEEQPTPEQPPPPPCRPGRLLFRLRTMELSLAPLRCPTAPGPALCTAQSSGV